VSSLNLDALLNFSSLENIKSDIMEERVWTVALMDILEAEDRKQSLGDRPSAACGETLESHFTGVGE